MTGHDGLLARARSRRIDFAQGAGFKGSDRYLMAELEAALRAERADREIADTALETYDQALWDIYTASGADTDGDTDGKACIAGMGRDRYALMVLEAVCELAEVYDEALDVPAADTATECPTCGGTKLVKVPDRVIPEWCPDCVPAADTDTESTVHGAVGATATDSPALARQQARGVPTGEQFDADHSVVVDDPDNFDQRHLHTSRRTAVSPVVPAADTATEEADRADDS